MPHYKYLIVNKKRKKEDNILNTQKPTKKTEDKKTLKTASKETAEKNYAMEDPQTNSKIGLGCHEVPSSSSRDAACSLSSQSIEPRPKSRHDANSSEQPQEKDSFSVQHREESDQSSTEHSDSRSSAAPSGFRCISKNELSIVSMEKPLTVAKGVLSEAHLVVPPLPGKPTEASAVEAELPLSVSEETQPTREASQLHAARSIHDQETFLAALNLTPSFKLRSSGELTHTQTRLTGASKKRKHRTPVHSLIDEVADAEFLGDNTKPKSPKELKSRETETGFTPASCHSCHQSFDSINQLSDHVRAWHQRRCFRCGINHFDTLNEFLIHHKSHIRPCWVKLRGLGPEYRQEAEDLRKEISKNYQALFPKIRLRLTSSRKAKAAEQRIEQERRQSAIQLKSREENMENDMEVLDKIIESLQSESAEFSSTATLPPEPSPATSISLSYVSSPASTPALSPPAQSVQQPLISVRSTASLMSESALRNLSDKEGDTVQQNADEPEFVSVERLADNNITLASILTPPQSNTPIISQTLPSQQAALVPEQHQLSFEPQTTQQVYISTQHVFMAQQQEPPPMAQRSLHHLLSAPNMSTLGMQQRQAPLKANPAYRCSVCNYQATNMDQLNGHRTLQEHFMCPMCRSNFKTQEDVMRHHKNVHAAEPVQRQHNPLPTYQQHMNKEQLNGAFVMQQNPYHQHHQQQLHQMLLQQQMGGPSPPGLHPMQPSLQGMIAMQQRVMGPMQMAPGIPPYQMAMQPRGVIRQSSRHRFQQPNANNVAHRQAMQGTAYRQANPNTLTPLKRPTENQTGQQGAPPAKKRTGLDIPVEQPDDCQIIAVQRGGDGVPQITSVQGAASRANEISSQAASTLLSNSNISVSIQPIDKDKGKPQSEVVASILKDRGITVTAKTVSEKPAEQDNKVENRSALANIPEVLINNKNIQISQTPKVKNGSKTEMPAPGAPAQNVNRPTKPQTVDITAEARANANNPQNKKPSNHNVTCQICNKGFATTNALNIHTGMVHSEKVIYRCKVCNAAFTSADGLRTHEVTHNKDSVPPGGELAIPLVNVQDATVVNNLARIGINYYIPLSNSEGSGSFSIPVISAESSVKNPNVSIDLGAISFLKIGQMNALNNRRT
ncbi:uncharacterized protein LOC135934775 isoform X2 [Cloeon dipterum]